MMKEGCSKTTSNIVFTCKVSKVSKSWMIVLAVLRHRSPWKLIVCIMAQKPLTSLIRRQQLRVAVGPKWWYIKPCQRWDLPQLPADFSLWLKVPAGNNIKNWRREAGERERLILIYTKQQLQWQSGVELWTRPLSSPGNDFSERRTESKGGRKS